MGVRGLTTFINRNEKYMENYVIPPGSILVLDGESVAINIYLQYVKERNTIFGGDYEVYANAVITFFNILFKCNIIPYVVCSGAIETRKIDTVLKRTRNRINRTIELDNRTEKNDPIFPLFIGEVFRDILKKLNVNMVVCDFEADLEVANIAKQLDVPVLSCDSDFYIFDVKYIPFSLQGVETIPNLIIQRKRQFNKGEPEYYMTCKIFNRKHFLMNTGISVEMLPVLTLFLGNDFVERVTDIRQFFNYLKLFSISRDFVGNIIGWLKNKNPKEALSILVNFFSKSEQVILHAKIDETIKGYTCSQSKYLKYFECKEIQSNCGDSEAYLRKFPKHFLNKYRQGLYQHNFMEILLNHTYYPKPLVENLNREHSYTKSYELISALYKILTNSSKDHFFIYVRVGGDISKQIVPLYKKELPSFDVIQEMDVGAKQKLLFEILQINKEFGGNCVDLFEDSWKILLITLKFVTNVSDITWDFIYSLVLCKIIITYVNSKIGEINKKTTLIHNFHNSRNYIYNDVPKKTNQHLSDFCTNEITIDDSIIVLNIFLPYFTKNAESEFAKVNFDRNLLHIMSEFQASLLHITFLNALLDLPYAKCHIWQCFNGTFIYRLSSELKTKGVDFVPYLLQKAPTVLKCFNFVIDNLKRNIKSL